MPDNRDKREFDHGHKAAEQIHREAAQRHREAAERQQAAAEMQRAAAERQEAAAQWHRDEGESTDAKTQRQRAHIARRKAQAAARRTREMARQMRREQLYKARQLQRDMRKPEEPVSPAKAAFKRVIGTAILAIVMALLLGLPVGFATSVLHPLIPWFPAILLAVLLGALWLIILFTILWLVGSRLKKTDQNGHFFGGHHHDRGNPARPGDPPPPPPSPHGKRPKYYYPMQEALDALDRLTAGDFSVLLDTEDRFYYGELAGKINELAERLHSVEQMRQEFVSNVTHELQSPLTSISGFAALLQKEDISEEKRLHYAAIIADESERLSKLSDNLLKLSLLDGEGLTIEKSPYRMDKQIQNTLLMMEPQWSGKNIELDIDLAEVTYSGDSELLSQVWVNLLHNAIKFTPSAGKIEVLLRDAEDSVYCTVRDNGPGISQEDRVHLFERFYKADKARDRSLGGSGLGLSLVKKISQLHGGEVRVESTLGQGAAFIVTLPKEAGG